MKEFKFFRKLFHKCYITKIHSLHKQVEVIENKIMEALLCQKCLGIGKDIDL